MAASLTCDSSFVSNIMLVSARCSGFAKVNGQNDYSYVIDLEWSDDRSMSIKRTYPQFQNFHTRLIKLFPELRPMTKSKLRLQSSLKENMTSLFAKDKQGLAESREQMIDSYLVNLLKQPERIRTSNIVISFFEPKESDPKPCKSSSPHEKSDSGIDLTVDRHSRNRRSTCETGEDSCVKPPPAWRDEYDSDWDADSSGTETDNDPFDEEYLLDVGFGELMLQSTDEMELSGISSESSTWCSNTNKFSNILNTLPKDNATRQYNKSLYDFSDDDYDELTKSSISFTEGRENSDTESQMVVPDHLSDNGLESDDEFSCKTVAQKDTNHYYQLSTNDLHDVCES